MKYKFKSFLVFFWCINFLIGCSNSGRLIGPSVSFDKNTHSIPSNYSQILLFREANSSTSKDAVFVQSNNYVIGALKEDDYVVSTVCPGSHSLHFETKGKQPNVQNITVDAPVDAITYMGVSVTDGGIINVKQYSEESALALLQDNTYQSYLVNRVIEECNPPTPPVKLKNIELSADALFTFDGSFLPDVIEKDKLNQLIRKTKDSGINITKIVVVGHTDRLGSKKYNQKLSEERAKTVANYLIANGAEGDIKAIGFGSAQPVTTQCSVQLPRNQLIQCLQPDRRVEVELWGSYKVIDEENSGK
jgi:outer membrane protein OmpA-like peptidoglycan-associated protein